MVSLFRKCYSRADDNCSVSYRQWRDTPTLVKLYGELSHLLSRISSIQNATTGKSRPIYNAMRNGVVLSMKYNPMRLCVRLSKRWGWWQNIMGLVTIKIGFHRLGEYHLLARAQNSRHFPRFCILLTGFLQLKTLKLDFDNFSITQASLLMSKLLSTTLVQKMAIERNLSWPPPLCVFSQTRSMQWVRSGIVRTQHPVWTMT